MSAQAAILAKYGQPNAKYFTDHCVVWHAAADHHWLADVLNTATGMGMSKVYINQAFKERLSKAFRALEAAKLHREIKTYDGCFNERTVRGSFSTSLHAWAMAIDLNASIEKLGQHQTYWSNGFLMTMRNCGIYWGGDWTNRKDSMHFAFYNG
jgi:hypothetical protein